MEELLQSFSREGTQPESPPWHKKALEETATRYDAGKEQPIEWTPRNASCGSALSEDLLPNLLPKTGRLGDSGRRASGFQQLTEFYLRLRGFESTLSAN